MNIATSELEHLREEVKNCHRIIKNLQNKREFVGLTDDERSYYLQSASNVGWWQAAQFIEAKLKEKNFV